MEKTFIKNRNQKNLSLEVDSNPDSVGVAFVVHGLGGFKEQPHIRSIACAIYKLGYTVILYDARNTFGESEGSYMEATVSGYLQDLEDVIGWASSQEWYQEPFVLAGHSIGAMVAVWYAQESPEKVKILIPVSPVISGVYFCETKAKDVIEKWESLGTWSFGESESRPGAQKKLKWQFIQDIIRYNLLDVAERLTMPILLINGENDTTTPIKYFETFKEKLGLKVSSHIIANAPHTFLDRIHLDELEDVIEKWVRKN